MTDNHQSFVQKAYIHCLLAWLFTAMPSLPIRKAPPALRRQNQFDMNAIEVQWNLLQSMGVLRLRKHYYHLMASVSGMQYRQIGKCL